MKVPDPLFGQQLGNYLIQHALGQGGMARVYKGLDVSLKRAVAVKVMDEGVRQSEVYAQRFEHEAQAVAKLSHPNIVGVFYFSNQDTLYYLVMEYIDGTDLEAILHNYADNHELMPYADVMRILEAIALALDYAHEHGVIHRDVKPSNIMVERTGRPVLTDFGLALRVSEGTVGDTFGTPHYISPEQAQNSANAVPQSDLYSLGVIAYEMLSGTVPFDDPSPTALAMQHIMATVPSPRFFNPNLSEAVEQVLFKILAKEPHDRYKSGAEFVSELRLSLEATLRSPRGVNILSEPTSDEDDRIRHVSMQTVLDKVHQELAIQQAKGQTVTRSSDEAASSAPLRLRPRISSLLPYIVATSMAVIGLIVIAVIVSSSANTPTATPTDASLFAAGNASLTPILPTETIIPPTATLLPPSSTSVPPTNTPALESLLIAPTHTAIPQTTTLIVPTVTPLPPVATPTPPSEATIPADVPPGATTAPSDWLAVRFIYNNDAFYWMNDSSRSINARPIVFERVGAIGRFEGQLWAYWTMEAGRCMEINFVDNRNPQRPNGCRPNAFFTPTRSQTTNFWTGTGQFRVLWNGAEIAICEIAAGECTGSVPPA